MVLGVEWGFARSYEGGDERVPQPYADPLGSICFEKGRPSTILRQRAQGLARCKLSNKWPSLPARPFGRHFVVEEHPLPRGLRLCLETREREPPQQSLVGAPEKRESGFEAGSAQAGHCGLGMARKRRRGRPTGAAADPEHCMRS